MTFVVTAPAAAPRPGLLLVRGLGVPELEPGGLVRQGRN